MNVPLSSWDSIENPLGPKSQKETEAEFVPIPADRWLVKVPVFSPSGTTIWQLFGIRYTTKNITPEDIFTYAVARCGSFVSWPDNIPLCDSAMICLFTALWMEIWDVSRIFLVCCYEFTPTCLPARVCQIPTRNRTYSSQNSFFSNYKYHSIFGFLGS
jgi:hypothetical protein